MLPRLEELAHTGTVVSSGSESILIHFTTSISRPTGSISKLLAISQCLQGGFDGCIQLFDILRTLDLSKNEFVYDHEFRFQYPPGNRCTNLLGFLQRNSKADVAGIWGFPLAPLRFQLCS